MAEIILIGLVGGWLGLLAGGNLDAGGRPAADPAVGGSRRSTAAATLSIPPLGELRVHTHAGPWRLTAEVTRIDAADARRIFSNPAAVNGLGEKVVE